MAASFSKTLASLALAAACCVSPALSMTAPLPADVVVKFPPGTWIENIAVRSNGMLLATELTSQARVYQINPFIANAQPEVVYQFNNTGSVLGITEVEQDVFCVATSNFSIVPNLAGHGEDFIYKIDFNGVDPATPSAAKVSQVAHLTKAQGLNGMAFVGGDSRTVLVADIVLGVIWGVDIDTGDYAVAINTTQTNAKGIGSNGVKVVERELYFSNTAKTTFYKVPIDATGKPTGNFTTLLTGQVAPDDFAVSCQGDVYAADNNASPQGLAFIPREGGNSTFLAEMKGPTSAAFGRTDADMHTLYVTTNGGITQYLQPNTTVTVSGKIFRVQVGRAGAPPNVTTTAA